MSTIKKKINKNGIVWRLDYYDPAGRRIRKDFDLKKDAEAYRGRLTRPKRKGAISMCSM